MKYPHSTRSKKYPKFIRDNKTLLKHNNVRKIFPKIGLDNCEEKLPNGLTICFSSYGNKGFWDIATMSMRGIKSCQRWSHRLSKNLIGTMIDPCAGIVYITDNRATSKGKRMLARAVVRFVFDYIGNKYKLMLEPIYYNRTKNLNQQLTANATARIEAFLERKTESKFQITCGDREGYLTIPLTNAVNKLPQPLRSYRDSHIEYGGKLPKICGLI